ncbi:MAG: hypothetical protein GY833_21640 [Aestuariibacter sp.]|nr:hypothetical protein [Aestuariibacter sp.]|tara:strand:+ start:120162 stop:120356 length:195 start_codon:yes stop_codon:yes gene_type:complete
MKNGDEYYEESTKGFSNKAHYKLATLMKHGYVMQPSAPSAARVVNGADDLLVLPNGDVFKKVIY